MDRRQGFYDNAARRELMRLNARRRQRVLSRERNRPRYDLEYAAEGMPGLTTATIEHYSQALLEMDMEGRLIALQDFPLMARHFPHLDPRNVPRPRGPVLPLHRGLIVAFIRTWDAPARARYFHLCPWMRSRFPECQPRGGWPERLFAPLRIPAEHGNLPVEGPAERYEDWPNQDPFYDHDPFNYVQSRRRLTPSPPRRYDRSRSRSTSPLSRLRLGRRTPSPPLLQLRLGRGSTSPPLTRLRLGQRSQSPASLDLNVRQQSPARELSSEPSSPRRTSPSRELVLVRTPSPRIDGRMYRRTPPLQGGAVDTVFRLGPPGTYYTQPRLPEFAAEEFFDPDRYRRGDPPTGYIGGEPPPPIYHDFDPAGRRLEDEESVQNRARARPPVYPPVDERHEVDYDLPPSRGYALRNPMDEVWDDNFSPAELGNQTYDSDEDDEDE